MWRIDFMKKEQSANDKVVGNVVSDVMKVQECDARMHHSSNADWLKKKAKK